MPQSLGRPTPARRATDLAQTANAVAGSCTQDFERCVNTVIDRCGDKAQTLAHDAGLSEFQFSRQRHSAPAFIDKLPPHVQREIARRFAEAHDFKVLEPVTEERIAALVAELADATKTINEITAAHLRAQMRRQS
jgi:hypothetical protein